MLTEENIGKPLQELWQDYLFLTKEMEKFLNKDEFELFLEIMEQREKMQGMIEAGATSDDFPSSPGGQVILGDINRINKVIQNKLQYLMNIANRQHDVSRAYDEVGLSNVGGRMDWQT